MPMRYLEEIRYFFHVISLSERGVVNSGERHRQEGQIHDEVDGEALA